jgi:hypothetical protein
MPPSGALWEEIERFALTFNGYDHCDSLEACAALAEARQYDTLSNMRACLFCEQRSWCFTGSYPDARSLAHVWELMELIRARVRLVNEFLA